MNIITKQEENEEGHDNTTPNTTQSYKQNTTSISTTSTKNNTNSQYYADSTTAS